MLWILLALACRDPLDGAIAEWDGRLTPPRVTGETQALPRFAPRLLVVEDAAIIDARSWRIQPAFADAGLAAELDAAARTAAQPAALTEREGALVPRLHAHLAGLADLDRAAAEAQQSSRHDQAALRLVVDASVSAAALQPVLTTAGRAGYSRFVVEVGDPAEARGVALELPPLLDNVAVPAVLIGDDHVSVVDPVVGTTARAPCHLPGCAAGEGTGLDRFVDASVLEPALGLLPRSERALVGYAGDAPLALVLELATRQRSEHLSLGAFSSVEALHGVTRVELGASPVLRVERVLHQVSWPGGGTARLVHYHSASADSVEGRAEGDRQVVEVLPPAAGAEATPEQAADGAAGRIPADSPPDNPASDAEGASPPPSRPWRFPVGHQGCCGHRWWPEAHLEVTDRDGDDVPELELVGFVEEAGEGGASLLRRGRSRLILRPGVVVGHEGQLGWGEHEPWALWVLESHPVELARPGHGLRPGRIDGGLTVDAAGWQVQERWTFEDEQTSRTKHLVLVDGGFSRR